MSKQRKPTEKLEEPQRKSTIKLRESIKDKKPKFIRQESWRYLRLKENWRRPKGLDNKVRKHVKGWPKSPRIGYRGPKIARGLHPSGYKETIVRNVDELNKVDSATTAVKIARTIGMQKRRAILIKARDLGIRVLNAKEIKEEEKEIEKEEAISEEEMEQTVETKVTVAEKETGESVEETAEEEAKKPQKKKRGRKKKQKNAEEPNEK